MVKIKHLRISYSFMQIICMNGEYLPTSGFNWLTQDEIKKVNVNTSWKVCVVEVDLEYPEKLHDLHNDYLLEIKENMLSGYCEKSCIVKKGTMN